MHLVGSLGLKHHILIKNSVENALRVQYKQKRKNKNIDRVHRKKVMTSKIVEVESRVRLLEAGRQVCMPHFGSVVYGSAKEITGAHQSLLKLVDHETARVKCSDALEDLKLGALELRAAAELIRLGVCFVDQSFSTLMTVHPAEGFESEIARVRVQGKYRVFYICKAAFFGSSGENEICWSSVVRLLAHLGLLRQLRTLLSFNERRQALCCAVPSAKASFSIIPKLQSIASDIVAVIANVPESSSGQIVGSSESHEVGKPDSLMPEETISIDKTSKLENVHANDEEQQPLLNAERTRYATWLLKAFHDLIAESNQEMQIERLNQMIYAVLGFLVPDGTEFGLCYVQTIKRFNQIRDGLNMRFLLRSSLWLEASCVKLALAPGLFVFLDLTSGLLSRPRRCDLEVLEDLRRFPGVPSDLFRRIVVAQPLQTLTEKKSDELPIEDVKKSSAVIQNTQKLSGSAQEGETTDGEDSATSSGKVSKFKKLKKAVSSLFSCLPFCKTALAVLE